ncbi:xanthine dehydrogenase small subunit [Devosia crocina]|uniref:Xanthine dehydrogenase small subunit n=2 Tax=Devosia crocina TaxID=429728 RepID=A0A1I7NVQ6_9HYPH|nr:xanthine dehydrogenase small subunit [Devosia crocina]
MAMRVKHRSTLRFYLNDEFIELDRVEPYRNVLDWLRLEQHLRGTKEGCAEGDCGACTVLVGRIDRGGALVYEAVNACIRLLSTLDGTHLVTIEDLARDGVLNPVQQSLVDCHASQCGFCTPGMVMSLYADWLDNRRPTVAEVEKTLQGNLCRCTGYDTIVRAAQYASDHNEPRSDRLNTGRAKMKERLLALRDGARLVLRSGDDRAILPASSDDLAAVLMEQPGATIVAGATDVGLWINKFLQQLPVMVHLQRIEDLTGISAAEGTLTIGAVTTFAEAEEAIAQHLPQLAGLWSRIGGRQVRNAGTIGGNIANGSPIGDTPPPLIVLGSQVNLRRGNERRSVPLEDFFIAYGRQDRQPGEFIETITVPLPGPEDRIAAYKVSKRFDEDISSVLGAFRLRLDSDLISEITIAYGGMAATPKRARAVEGALLGREWTRETIESVLPLYAHDFTPLSDWRASADYRLLVAQNLLLRFWRETTGIAPVQVRELLHG